jgi:WhiB family redox-sensing transcriptional regulator
VSGTAGVPRLSGRVATRSDFDTQEWAGRAACLDADPELFYHPEDERGSARPLRDVEAKQVCAGCDVRKVCLEYALERRERFGVWGGTTEEERAVLLRDAGRRVRAFTPDEIDKIRRLYADGHTQTQIATRLGGKSAGWTQATVSVAMRRHGIEARGPRHAQRTTRAAS